MATSVFSVETILLTRKIIAKIILFKSIIYFDQFPSTSRFELTFDLPLLDIYCVTLVNIKQSPKDIFFYNLSAMYLHNVIHISASK